MTAHPHRRPRLAAAALLAGVPLLWATAAYAQPTAAYAQPTATVTFTGGCASELTGPRDTVTADPGSVTVPPGAELQIMNHLGAPATLLLDGDAAAELPAGQSLGVVLHDGPVVATMALECPDGEVTGTATVEVAGPAGGSGPADTPSGSASPESRPRESPSPESGASGSTAPTGGDGASPDTEPEQMSASGGSPSDAGLNGVLALVAAACVAGVMAAAIRTVAARRPSRAEWT